MTHILNNRTLSLTSAMLLAAILLFGPVLLFASHGGQHPNDGVPQNDAENTDVDPNILQRVSLTIGNMVLSTAAVFTWIGGMLLDYSIQEVVLKMGEIVRSDGIGHTINNTWEIVRDIANLVFIFGFVYIGIWTILSPGAAQTKRFLTQLIIAALLINFSLFFTKVVIDVANIFALEIHETLVTQSTGGNQQIAYAFMNAMGLEGLYDTQGNFSSEMLRNFSTGGAFWFFILGAVFLLVAAFVLAAGAIMLAIRFVGLVLIMIFSPILFAATVFPQTARYASELWGKLFSYAFFAPAYLFLLYISLQIANANFFGALDQSSMLDAMQGFNANNDSFTVILKFVIIILFLIFALQAAKRFGVYGGEAAVKTGNYIRGTAQRKVVAGRANWMQKRYDRFDARDSGTAKAARKLGLTRGMRSLTDTAKSTKFGGASSYSDVQKLERDIKKGRDETSAVLELEDALKSTGPDREQRIERAVRNMTKGRFEKAGVDKLNNEEILKYASNSQMEDVDKIDSFTDAEKDKLRETRAKAIVSLLSDDKGELVPEKLRKASPAQLEAAGLEFLKREDVAGPLAANQIDDLRKSKKVLEAEVGEIEKQRDAYFTEVVKDPARVRKEVEERKPKDAAKLPAKVLKAAPANAIKPEMFHQMIDQKVDRETQQAVYKNLMDEFSNLDQTMQHFLQTDFVRGRFESRRGDGQQSRSGQNTPSGGPGGQQSGGESRWSGPGAANRHYDQGGSGN